MRGGKRDGGHEVSILIRVSDGERSGRVPSKVSTMIILPPQQAHGREGEDVSSRSARDLGHELRLFAVGHIGTDQHEAATLN